MVETADSAYAGSSVETTPLTGRQSVAWLQFAVVSHLEWQRFPGLLWPRLFSVSPVVIALNKSKRYFWPLLRFIAFRDNS